MSTVKGLKLLKYLSAGVGKKFYPGEYTGEDIPPELLAELEAGSKVVEEMTDIPSISQVKAPAPKQDLSKQKTIETVAEPPKKPTPPKPTAKAAAKPTPKKTTRRTPAKK